MAVTKGFGPDAVEAASAVGLADVGETYAQERVDKVAARAEQRLDAGPDTPSPRFHFIGRLQRATRVRQIAGPYVARLAERRPASGWPARSPVYRPAPPCSSCSTCPARRSRAGAHTRTRPSWPPERIPPDRPRRLQGLMGVGPAGQDSEAARPGFRRLVAAWRTSSASPSGRSG